MTRPVSTPFQSRLSGLGWWNTYFIVKIALYLQGVIDFHALENLAFVLLLLLPVSPRPLIIARNIIALPIAAWLLHYDSFFPPLERLWAQAGQLMQFETSYLLELAGRFVSFNTLIALFVVMAGYYILSKYLRVSVFVSGTLLYLAIPQGGLQPAPAVAQEQADITRRPVETTAVSEINDEVLNQYQSDFFSSEAERSVTFSPASAQDAPFDLLFLSICSLAWDDIKITELQDHPLFKEFDIMFDNFSTATSYSGPAVIRLLRANCGQEEHTRLFDEAPNKQCYLFENLKSLGFEEQLLMNHDGVFDSFLELIKRDGRLTADLMPQDNLKPYQKAFDGAEIYRDKDVLDKWWQERVTYGSEKVVALYNTTSLHDGNRLLNAKSASSLISYKRRLQNLLDDLYSFFKQLEQSKRNIVVALVPEHGAGMRGDRMQISGMREIPAPTIVHTPVAVKIFGEGIKRSGETTHIKQPSSYLALSQVVENILEQDVYQTKKLDVKMLTSNLPETPPVAQNSGSTVMKVNGKYYISLDGNSWTEYPVR
ncbi:cellulose biosynthesis protein BcsG [Psychromonas aquimarina]|uniref:cellulose biosynthesis protein BcsG n=1 Tax=Psychromonas aquimarina TaxID=444919 RepID=UPI00041D880E|nr:cellulose biosynthesis protein BcsG [Psychromonas aquimarina]